LQRINVERTHELSSSFFSCIFGEIDTVEEKIIKEETE
jgi:hypothetical protein